MNTDCGQADRAALVVHTDRAIGLPLFNVSIPLASAQPRLPGRTTVSSMTEISSEQWDFLTGDTRHIHQDEDSSARADHAS